MKKRKKLLIYAFVCLFVLTISLVILFFFATSSYFITNYVLPEISENVGLPINVRKVELSVFNSSIDIDGLRIGEKDANLLSSESIKAEWDIWSIIGGVIAINKLELREVKANLVKNANGQWNFQKKGSQSQSSKSKSSNSKPGKFEFPVFDLSDISVEDLNLNIDLLNDDPQKNVKIAVTNFQFNLPRLVNKLTSTIKMKGDINYNSADDIKINAHNFQAEITTLINKSPLPEKLQINLESVLHGKIRESEINNRHIELSLDIKQSFPGLFALKHFRLKELGPDKGRSEITVAGTLSPYPTSADLTIKIEPLSSGLLNLFGDIAGGISFGDGNLRYDGKVLYRDKKLSLSGILDCKDFLLTSKRQQKTQIPAFDILFNYDIKDIDFIGNSVAVDLFNLSVLRKRERLVTLDLSNKCALSWERGLRVTGEAPKLQLEINKINIALINHFLPKSISQRFKSGFIAGKVSVIVEDNGANLPLSGELYGEEIDVQFGEQSWSNLSFYKQIDCHLRDFINFSLKDERIFKQDGIEFLRTKSTGDYSLLSHEGSLECEININNDQAVKLLPKFLSWCNMLDRFFHKLSNSYSSIAVKAEFSSKKRSLKVTECAVNLTQNNQTAVKANLKSPWRISWPKNKSLKINDPLNVRAIVNSQELILINSFIPIEAPFKFISGAVSADLAVSMTDCFMDLKASGECHVDQATFTVDGKSKFKKISWDSKPDFEMNDYLNYKIFPSYMEFAQRGRKVAKLTLSGQFDLTKETGEFKGAFDSINHLALNIPPWHKPSENPFAKLLLRGDASYSYDLLNSKMLYSGDIQISKLRMLAGDPAVGDIKGNLKLSSRQGERRMELDQLEINLNDEKENIADINAHGFVALPFNEGDTRLKINSKKLRIKVLQDAMLKPEKDPELSKDSDKEKDKKVDYVEPPACDFGQTDVFLDVDMKNLSYGPKIKADLDGEVSLSNNILKFYPLNILCNKTLINVNGFMDLGKSNGYPYSLKGNFADLKIEAFAQTFMKKSPVGVKGRIRDFNVDLSGKGFTPENLSEHLKARLNMSCKNLEMPVQSQEYHIMKLFFIPLSIIANIHKVIPKLTMSKDIASAAQGASDILGNKKNLGFSEGIVQVNVKKGVVRIREFCFTGDDIRKLTFQGKYDFNKGLDLRTELNINRIIVPLELTGPLKKPKTNIKNFIPLFLKTNAINMLHPRNLGDIIDFAIGVVSKKNKEDPKKKKKKEKTQAQEEKALKKDNEELLNVIDDIVE